MIPTTTRFDFLDRDLFMVDTPYEALAQARVSGLLEPDPSGRAATTTDLVFSDMLTKP